MEEILRKILEEQKNQRELIFTLSTEKFVSKAEFVEKTGLSNYTVKKALKEKRIPFIKTGEDRVKIPLNRASNILGALQWSIKD